MFKGAWWFRERVDEWVDEDEGVVEWLRKIRVYSWGSGGRGGEWVAEWKRREKIARVFSVGWEGEMKISSMV